MILIKIHFKLNWDFIAKGTLFWCYKLSKLCEYEVHIEKYFMIHLLKCLRRFLLLWYILKSTFNKYTTTLWDLSLKYFALKAESFQTNENSFWIRLSNFKRYQMRTWTWTLFWRWFARIWRELDKLLLP